MINGLYDLFQQKWQGQTIWIISDTHFSDYELSTGINRPTDEELVKKINSKVGCKDILIHLGDVGNTEFVQKLRGYKILVMGNHDGRKGNYKRDKHIMMYEKFAYTQEQAIQDMQNSYPNYNIRCEETSKAWTIHADNNLFDEAYEGALIIGEKLILSHEPLSGIDWAMNIHGHIHDQKHKNDMNHFNVCLDACDYEPLNLNQFVKGGCSKIKTIHRATIDKATERKNKEINL